MSSRARPFGAAALFATAVLATTAVGGGSGSHADAPAATPVATTTAAAAAPTTTASTTTTTPAPDPARPIAYWQSADGGPGEIVAIDPATGAEAPLAVPREAAPVSAWAPDHRRFVYLRSYTPSGYRCRSMFVMDHDGTDHARIANTCETSAAWSPDGNRIAFSSWGRGMSSIWVMDADGTDRRKLTDPGEPVSGSNGADTAGDFSPTWSPDGARIAFSRYLAKAHPDGIYTVSVANGTVSRPSPGGGLGFGPAWSPDGSFIAFTASADDGSRDLFVMAPDGTGVRNLTPHPPFDLDQRDSIVPLTDDAPKTAAPTWSPDGRRVAFLSTADHAIQGDQTYELYLVGVDGSGIRRLTTSPNREEPRRDMTILRW